MADKIISVVGTVASKLPNLPIKDAQLIFVRDKQKIALDLGGKRTFYNEIIVFETEQEREDLLAPINGSFYFIVSTAVLWFYNQQWIQLTTPPEDIVCIGTELPTLGTPKAIYVNKSEQNISVWDDEEQKYLVVGEKCEGLAPSEIDLMFN